MASRQAQFVQYAQRAFRERAKTYLQDPARARTLLRDAAEKAGRADHALGDIREQFMALLRLIRAYVTGRYTNIAWRSILTATVAVLYFVVPTDVIPDFIIGLGFVDDALVLGWAIHSLRSELDAFRQWEKSQPTPTTDDPTEPGATTRETGRSTEFH